MAFAVLVLLASLLPHSCTSPTSEDLFSNDLDTLDYEIAFFPNSLTQDSADSNIFSDESLNSNLNLPSPSVDFAQADLNLDNEPGGLDDSVLAADPNIVSSENYCSSIFGQSRKRDQQCTSPDAPINTLTLPNLLPSENDEKKDTESEEGPFTTMPRKTDEYDMDKCKGHGLLPVLQRVIDVCCDGEYGPYFVDQWGRLIYSHIKNCELGTSGIALHICAAGLNTGHRLLYALPYADQCLL